MATFLQTLSQGFQLIAATSDDDQIVAIARQTFGEYRADAGGSAGH
jgi:hypothetical protein